MDRVNGIRFLISFPRDEGKSSKSRENGMEGRRELFYRPSRFSTVQHFTRADFNLISFSKKKGYYIIV